MISKLLARANTNAHLCTTTIVPQENREGRNRIASRSVFVFFSLQLKLYYRNLSEAEICRAKIPVD